MTSFGMILKTLVPKSHFKSLLLFDLTNLSPYGLSPVKDTALYLHCSTNLFIIFSFLVRHQNKGERHLFGKFTGSNKRIDSKELLKGMSHKLEGAINVPGLRSGRYG